MRDSSVLFARLRARLAVDLVPDLVSARREAGRGGALFTLGVDAVDARLGGGLARGALHELFGAAAEDAVAANGFALMLALRARAVGPTKPLIWIRGDGAARRYGRLHGPGLAEMGADPGGVMLVQVPDDLAALRAGADALGCAGVSAVIIEIGGKARVIDLTVTRRLALGAARSGVTALLVRSEAEPRPSAAATRWDVSAAPSAALPGNAPGQCRLTVRLLRHRAGRPGFETCMEWNRDAQIFRAIESADAALPRAVPAAASGGPDQGDWRLAG